VAVEDDTFKISKGGYYRFNIHQNYFCLLKATFRKRSFENNLLKTIFRKQSSKSDRPKAIFRKIYLA
jgi:hypothetical protein